MLEDFKKNLLCAAVVGLAIGVIIGNYRMPLRE
jgi:large-conductance mechanosensitive channel